MRSKVSVVLPVYNERENLEKLVLSILRLKKKLSKYDVYIIISDSHSNDGTGAIAERLSKTYKNVHHLVVGRGIGVGLYRGHKYALTRLKPNIMIQMDADGQTDEKIVLDLVKTIEKGYSLVLGSRFVSGGKNELPFIRRIFSIGSSMVCRIIMGPWDIQEFTNSARAFTPGLFKKINWRALPWREKSFIMLPAFINEAVVAGAKYEEIPLIFKNRPVGYSKNNIINYTRDILIYTIKVRLRRWKIDL